LAFEGFRSILKAHRLTTR